MQLNTNKNPSQEDAKKESNMEDEYKSVSEEEMEEYLFHDIPTQQTNNDPNNNSMELQGVFNTSQNNIMDEMKLTSILNKLDTKDATHKDCSMVDSDNNDQINLQSSNPNSSQ